MVAGDEDFATVTFNSTNTLGGGEVTLSGGRPAVDELGKGHWIMVYDGAFYQWYRIAAIDKVVTAGADRSCTLAGRDWLGATTAQALVMYRSPVVGVYERTIRLDASALY
jgi:hypothetical protein